MENNSAGGVGNGSGGSTTAMTASAGPNQLSWAAPQFGGGGSNELPRANGSNNNPATGPPMDIQQILQQQQVLHSSLHNVIFHVCLHLSTVCWSQMPQPQIIV